MWLYEFAFLKVGDGNLGKWGLAFTGGKKDFFLALAMGSGDGLYVCEIPYEREHNFSFLCVRIFLLFPFQKAKVGQNGELAKELRVFLGVLFRNAISASQRKREKFLAFEGKNAFCAENHRFVVKQSENLFDKLGVQSSGRLGLGGRRYFLYEKAAMT